MLSKEDNDLITRTDNGAVLGQMMRRYWLPALLSEEIPERDGRPVRVRLLGEELVAFRDSEGKVGLLGEHWDGERQQDQRERDGLFHCCLLR